MVNIWLAGIGVTISGPTVVEGTAEDTTEIDATGGGNGAESEGAGGGSGGGAIEVGKLDVIVGTGAKTTVDVGTGVEICSVVLGSGRGTMGGIEIEGTGPGIMIEEDDTTTTGGRAREVGGRGTAAIDDEETEKGADELETTDGASVEAAGGRALDNNVGPGRVVYCVNVMVTIRVGTVVGKAEETSAVWVELLSGMGRDEMVEKIIGPSMAVDDGSAAPVDDGLG
jgi:hypothetical protein